MSDLATTLAARKAVHGEFRDHAGLAQALKDVARGGCSWEQMEPMQREAVDMILHKIARACAGNPHYVDHWHDIAGYARLVEERLPQGEAA